MRVVLVGASGFGRDHLQVWRKHPRVNSLVVVGRDAARLAAIAAEFEVDTTTDYAAALAAADLVDLCTPPDSHFELALQAQQACRPTIVEKPPCRTSSQAEELASGAAAPLFCVQNLRFSPLWQRVRQLIETGAIGRPLLSLWPVLTDQRRLLMGDDFRADAARGGGAMLDGAFHYAYLIPFALGAPLTAVTAWTGQLVASPPAGEDTGLVTFEVAGGVAQLTYSWAIPNPPRTPAATIVGDAGTLLVPRSAKQPLELLVDRETRELDLGEFQSTSRNDLGNCLGHYLDCVVSGANPVATWSEAVTAQQAIEALERAASTGRREVIR